MALAPLSDPPSVMPDKGPRPLKSPWSQVVRGETEQNPKAQSTELTQTPIDSRKQPQVEKRIPISIEQEKQASIPPTPSEPGKESQTGACSMEPRVGLSNGSAETTVENTSKEARPGAELHENHEIVMPKPSVAEAKVSKAGPHDSAGSNSYNSSSQPGTGEAETKSGAIAVAADARDSKPIWQRPLPDSINGSEVQTVMGADAWPALAETRNMKPSDMKKSSSKINSSPGKTTAQESESNDGSKFQQSRTAPKPTIKPSHSSDHLGNGGQVNGGHQSVKYNSSLRTKGGYNANPIVDNQRAPNGNGVRPFQNNARKWQNNNRDQARRNNTGHQYGRIYGNTGDMPILLHEQRIGPRNMQRPHPSFINYNPGFYHAPNFQNGGMYYLPSGSPDFVPGAPHYYHVPPPAGPMPGPDATALHTMLLKQIEYYFSVENLCKDVYLRSKMDEQGFVPVSLIAGFNRVKILATNPRMILDALRQSSIIEVQDDRVRRRDDWKKWVLPPKEYNVDIDDYQQKEGPVDAAFTAQNDSSNEFDAVTAKSAEGKSSEKPSSVTSASDDGYKTSMYSQSFDCKADQREVIVAGHSGRAQVTIKASSAESLDTKNRSDVTDVLENCHISNGLERSSGSREMNENAVDQSRTKDLQGHMKDPFYLQSNSEQNGSLHTDSIFSFGSQEKNSEDQMEVNDKDLQRLINVTRASFIAVP